MSLFADWKISNKLTVAFASLIIVMIGVSATIYSRLSFIQTSVRSTEHTYKVLEGLQDIMQSMTDQETGLRGYLVSADRSFLAPYNTGREAFEQAVTRVKDLIADNPAQQQQLSQIRGFAQRWREDVAEKEIALMGKPETREQASMLEGSGIGKSSVEGFRKIVGEMDKSERDRLQVHLADRRSAFSTAFAVTIAGGMISLVVAVGFGWLLTGSIAGPIVHA